MEQGPCRGRAERRRERRAAWRRDAALHLDITHGVHHDVAMRTTLTLDDDVAKELKAATRHGGRSLKEVVNEALRRGLRLGAKPGPGMPRFTVEPFSSPFQPGVDPTRLNQVLDELGTEDFLARLEREKTSR